MKGCDIKLALEQMIARCPAPVGSFPHLSDGWEAEYDLTQPAMQRIRAIKYLDSAISMEDSFLLAITDFYAEKGGDGVDAYMNKEVVATHGRTVCDCALEYFKGKQTISGKLPLRFVDKSLQ
jgi:2',3'-cyclic-nucleotide 2'-phosphodiesterase (5'-nucleotidase family)